MTPPDRPAQPAHDLDALDYIVLDQDLRDDYAWHSTATYRARMKRAADAITTLRAQLAERDRDWLPKRGKRCAYVAVHRDDLTAMKARVAALEAALRYYANPEIYKPHPHGPAFDRRDLSATAIAALKGAAT